MKKFMSVLLMLIIISTFSVVNATEEVIKIYLSDEKILINDEAISEDASGNIYLSHNMNNGGSSDEAKASNLEVTNVINIVKAGKYEFSGSLSDGQIAIDGNKIVGDVEIVLNNVNITCKNAPAIFIYSKDVNNDKCNVTISSAKDSINDIVGNRVKKVLVEEWNDKEDLVYYVEKNYDDEGVYYERYKYDGAISSDISLTFDGDGIINVKSTKKEGIETKMHFTMNGGTLIIDSLDDAINAAADGKSIITINDGKLVANVLSEAEEGDGIDSNGYLYINGGTIYAFAHPGSDNGLDSDLGTYINGGTVFSIGNMYEGAKTQKDKKIVQMSLKNKVKEGENLVIVDKNQSVMFAYKADREFSTITFSSDDLKDEDYNVYTGTAINGDVNEYNIYENVTSLELEKMTKVEATSNKFQDRFPMGDNMEIEEKDNTLYIMLIVAGVIVLIVILIVNLKSAIAGKTLAITNLIAGILVGSLIMYGVIGIAKNDRKMEFDMQKPNEMFEDKKMPREREAFSENNIEKNGR